MVFPTALWRHREPRALTFASLHQVNLASSQLPNDQTSLTPSSVSTCLLASHPLPTLPTTSASNHVVPPPTSSYFLLMTQLPSVPTSNYQLSTPTDHKTAMRRQQTPPNVPIIELGATCRRDISWGRSDCSNTALSRLYRVSVARRHGGRTCLTGWKTWALMPFSFFFAFHQSSLPFMTMSCSFEHTTTLPIYYQTPPTPSSLGYMPPVYTS